MRRKFRISAFISAVVVAGASVVYPAGTGDDRSGLATPAAPAEPVQAPCNSAKTTRQSYAGHGNNNQTTSTTFVDIPGAMVAFTAREGGCVAVLFTSMSYDDSRNIVFARAIVDGAVVGWPPLTQLDGDSDENDDIAWSRSHAMNFLFPTLSPGPHTVQMQFRSGGQGDPSIPVFIHLGSTIVVH